MVHVQEFNFKGRRMTWREDRKLNLSTDGKPSYGMPGLAGLGKGPES